MNIEDVEVGMSVNVKGSSPVMTVSSISKAGEDDREDYVHCSWKDVEGRDRSDWFPVDALEKSA